MTGTAMFGSEEIAAIEETLEKLKPWFPKERGRSWPFSEHHDLMSRRLRRGTRGRVSRARMAFLLAQWARERGDMSLYVLQAFSVATGRERPDELAGILATLDSQDPTFRDFLVATEGSPQVRS